MNGVWYVLKHHYTYIKSIKLRFEKSCFICYSKAQLWWAQRNISILRTNPPARLVWWRARWQWFYWKQFFAALHGIYAGAGQCKWGCGAGNSHSDRYNQRFCYIAQFFYSIREQCLEYAFAFSNWLWNKIAIAERKIRISVSPLIHILTLLHWKRVPTVF